MAKPSKYNRARIRSRVRRPKRRTGSRMWGITTAVVVVVGVVLVFLSYNDRQGSTTESPKVGEHWHAYLAFDVCDKWFDHSPADASDKGIGAPPFEQRANNVNLRAGIHSHGDGLMHIHPFSSDEAGAKATVGRFLGYGGWSVSGTSMKLWDGPEHTNGQKCGAGASTKPAEVQWIVGHQGKPWPTQARTDNPADFKPANGDIVVVYFLPKGDKLEKPPGADAALANISDVSGSTASSTPSSTPAAPSSAPTASTVPSSSSSKP